MLSGALRRSFHLALNSHLMPPSLRISAIPLFSDNYAWLISDSVSSSCLLVDPAHASTCLQAVAAAGPAVELIGSLTTHHHKDHAGGNAELALARPGLAIVGGALEEGRIEAATLLVADGQRFELGSLAFTAIHTPCHTRGHVCYFTDADPDAGPALFCGDTLFSGGCGRFFEGSAETMQNSLAKLKALPPSTRIFCGHEYTEANLRFCLHVEPQNSAALARAQQCSEQRARGEPTVPSSLSVELATNVFLRTEEPAVRAFTHPELSAEARAAVPGHEVLGRLRESKNAFK
jgi:hydroxyacylglutathione hydrolase